MERHPASATLRDFTTEEYAALVASMKRTGFDPAFPVLVHEGMVIDGWHRYRAAGEAGVEPVFLPAKLSGADPFGYVRDRHDARRHIQHGERALTAAAEATRPKGDRSTDPSLPTQSEAADKHHVSVPSVKRAKQILESGDESLIAAVRSGEMSVSQGVQHVRVAAQRERRTELERAALDVPAPDGAYKCIVVDPPWEMKVIKRALRPNQDEIPYPTMSLEQIRAINIPAAGAAHLWLWTTQRWLHDAMAIVEHWRFKRLAVITWCKPGGFQPSGLMQYTSEYLLVARRGALPFVETKAFGTWYQWPRGAHSEKPEAAYDLIRRVSPGPRIDMFGRRAIDGFTSWGAEAPAIAA